MSAEAPKPKMTYVNLGKSGLKVSRLILGCMSYGSNNDWKISDNKEAIRQIKYAYDQGINAFDTANMYSHGESERVLGEFLREHKIPRESVVILTKTFFADGNPEALGPSGDINNKGLSRKRIFASVKNSLERMGIEYIDVLQCHRFDKDTPIEETMQALHDVVQAGWVRYIGMSSCAAWQFQLMQQYAIHNRLTPFISMQNQYSAGYREEEREMMPMLKHFGVGVIPWSPLAKGVLCRPFDKMGETIRGASRAKLHEKETPHEREASMAIIGAIESIAERRGVSMAEIAIAWCAGSQWVTAPIVGVRSTERLDELIRGLEITLTAEERKEIEEGWIPQKP